jgi:hypothetical protein
MMEVRPVCVRKPTLSLIIVSTNRQAWSQWIFGGGERNSAATGYLGSQARERPNLSIVLNVHVKRVQPSVRDGERRLDFRTVEIGSKYTSKPIASSLQLLRTVSQRLMSGR